jgi:integrase
MPRRTDTTPRLTEKRVAALAFPAGRAPDSAWYVPDHKVERLYVRVRPSGRKTWVIRYYLHSKKQNLTLGTTEQLRLVDARAKAAKLLAELDVDGVDPKRTRRRPEPVPTFSVFLERYFRDHANQLRSKNELRRLAQRQLLPRFAQTRLTDIRLDAVLRMKAELAETPYEANRARNMLQAVLNKAIDWELVPSAWQNPVRNVPRFHERPRERVLTAAEIQRLLEAIDAIDSEHTRVLFRTLLEVPFRKNEVMRATWEGFDAEHRILRVESRSAIKGISAQPLRAELAAQVSALPRFADNPYICTNRDRMTHIKDIDSQWKRVNAIAGVTNARLHDLTRTIATDYARLGANAF